MAAHLFWLRLLSMRARMGFPDILRECYHRSDWSDVLAVKGAREVLMGVAYPDDATRRSLYASWLRVFASNRWHDSFDGLMLECVAATPSPTTPGRPLFADIFRVHDPVDRAPPRGPVLDVGQLPTLFERGSQDVADSLPSSPGFVDFLANLIRKSRTSRRALDEAGLIIGFCSLAMAVVVAKPVGDVRDFFRTRMKRALAAAVPTTFDGDVPCPNGRFLTALALKGHLGVVKPYIVLLVLGQYVYLVNAKDAAHSADLRFLEESFLTPAKFGHLTVVELLYEVQEQTGLSAANLNRILRDGDGGEPLSETCGRVDVFLDGAEGPMQRTRPWCRASNYYFFADLDLDENVDYAMRLMAFVAPDPNDHRWKRKELADVPGHRTKQARLWARNFKRSLRKGKYGQHPKQGCGS